MNKKVTCFLPCRKGSQRIPNKNTKSFAGVDGGLLRIKLEQLANCPSIQKVILSTNDEEVIKIAKSYSFDKLNIITRPEHLCTSETSTDDLVKYVPEIISDEHILWTHVTSPMLDSKEYEMIITSYFSNLETGFDSLMTVSKLQGFIWNESSPITYDRNAEKWPRTQTIKPLYEINSGVFLSSRENYLSLSDRIGNKPFLYVQDKVKSTDVDWPDDFTLAEFIYSSNLSS